MAKFLVEVRQLQEVDGDYLWKRIGQIDSYLSLDVILRYNDVGSWTLVLPANSPQAALLAPGTGVVVWYEGLYEPILSGPVRSIKSGWDESNPWPGTVEISGPDDNCLMAEHLCMPNPMAGLVNGQFQDYKLSKPYYTWVDESDPTKPKSVPYSVERLIRALPWYNFSANGNNAARNVNGCEFMPPEEWPLDTAYPKTTYNLRFETILEVVKSRAETGVMADGSTKPMGYKWIWDQITEKIKMDIYYPVNTPGLGKSVRFSRDDGNIAAYSYTLVAPKSNWMLFGLDQETAEHPETQHLYIADKRWDTTEWTMSAESYKDQTSTSIYIRDVDGKLIVGADGKPQFDTKAINTLIDTEWQSEAPMGGLTVTPIDTKGCKFGIHYYLGDLVTVIENDVETTSVLREVHFSDGSNGPTIQSTIGDSSATETPGLYKEIQRIWAALRRTQKNKAGSIYG